MTNLAQVLKHYRWACKIGVRELGNDIGVPAATISRIENGEMPDGNTLRKILLWLLK